MPSFPKHVGYVDPEYLRVVGDLLNHHKQTAYCYMQIEVGHRVLDVGCGPGTDTLPLAELVGAGGEVVGVDYDAAMVAEAERRAAEAGISRWVHHKVSSASALPFASGYFDSCRSERVFQHLSDAKAALAEMTRVTKHDGWVVVLDTDWGSWGIDCDESVDIEIERRFMRFFTEAIRPNGYSGRTLYRLFKEQGLSDLAYEVCPVPITSYAFVRQIMTLDEIEPKAVAANAISEDELRRWRASLERADAEGRFFSYFCLVLVAGRKI